jgi:DNA-binding transcriptional LysR family regulator
VLTEWALDGRGIVMKPLFDVAEHLARGALVPVCESTPPADAQQACLFPHKRNQDPKSRLFIEFMAERIKAELRAREQVYQLPR